MSVKHIVLAAALSVTLPTFAFAQGTIPGAEQGAADGNAAAGPVGGIVGGALGAATGTVGGVLGIPGNSGCASQTVRTEDGSGNSETVHRTNCP